MSNEMKIKILRSRINLLNARNPVANANIIHKLERQIRKLSAES